MTARYADLLDHVALRSLNYAFYQSVYYAHLPVAAVHAIPVPVQAIPVVRSPYHFHPPANHPHEVLRLLGSQPIQTADRWQRQYSIVRPTSITLAQPQDCASQRHHAEADEIMKRSAVHTALVARQNQQPVLSDRAMHPENVGAPLPRPHLE